MFASVNPPRRRYDGSGRRARALRTPDQIAEAARELFERSGYAQTTIAGVARAAGVSPETIYKAFGSKGALLRAVVSAAIRRDTESTPRARCAGARRSTQSARSPIPGVSWRCTGGCSRT